jgi:hypothetical protein
MWNPAFLRGPFSVRACSSTTSTKRTAIEKSYLLHGHELLRVDSVKYLGVTISSDLKWDTHISTIVNKANRTLGFLRRTLKTSDSGLKTTAYRALVRPTLEYACAVWDPYTSSNIKSIEKVQRRAVRWVLNRHRQTSCVDDMLQTLDWPSLQERRKHARLAMLYKHHNHLVTIPTKHPPTACRQRRNLRGSNSHQFDLPSSRTAYRQKSFFPRTIPEWNALPEAAVSAPSLDSFLSRLQQLTAH